MFLLSRKDSEIENNIKTVVTIGNFDGVHLGHQKLINRTIQLAKANDYKSVVLSFYPHPKKVLNKDFEFKTVCTQSEKFDLLLKMGVDYFRRKPIDLKFLGYTPKQFIENVLVKELNAKIVVVGSDFHFSSARGANSEMLKELCSEYGIETEIIDLKLVGNNLDEKISSSTIRQSIVEGDFTQVLKLMGRNYSITGKVIQGKKLGRTIGVPTANLLPENEKLLPKNGVYFSKTSIKGEKYNSITNIGKNPTVSNNSVIVETFILNFNNEIYDEFIDVEILEFLRDERKFSSIEELKNNLHNDINKARIFFEAH